MIVEGAGEGPGGPGGGCSGSDCDGDGVPGDVPGDDDWESSQTGNTRENVRILKKNIKNGDVLGNTKSPGDRAHHIVPGKHELAERARQILDQHRIDINGKENGVWLDEQTHYKTYPDSYVREVNRLVVRADQTGGRTAVLETLADIAQRTVNGDFFWLP
jgi:hypothetical protein